MLPFTEVNPKPCVWVILTGMSPLWGRKVSSPAHWLNAVLIKWEKMSSGSGEVQFASSFMLIAIHTSCLTPALVHRLKRLWNLFSNSTFQAGEKKTNDWHAYFQDVWVTLCRYRFLCRFRASRGKKTKNVCCFRLSYCLWKWFIDNNLQY